MTHDSGQERFVRTVIWRRLDVPSMEYCHLRQQAGDSHFDGTVVIVLDGVPYRLRYLVSADGRWHTFQSALWLDSARGTQSLNMLVQHPHKQRQWTVAGKEWKNLKDCIDVDLGITPSTNTLPIRRLNLAIGESADVTAAWVRFPELTVEPLAQRYTRLDERRYRYESASGFSAELEVDELGLVVRYGDIWERVGE